MLEVRRAALGLAFLVAAGGHQTDAGGASSLTLWPGAMRPVGTIDVRFQSYNVEMVEVTGGRFWKPYSSASEPVAPREKAPASPSGSSTPAGMNPDLYEYRPPIDLTNARLRRLAAGLGPAYVRVSGTWANTTFLPDSDEVPKAPPAGFGGVLTRAQWRGVVEFARAVDARIVTSFATGPGVRDAAGVWTPEQARRLLDYTKSLGGEVAAVELMNEPNVAAMGGAPAGYDAAAYGRDFKVFRRFLREVAPGTIVLGPGSVAETAANSAIRLTGMLKTRDLLAESGPGIDSFSYHHYGTVSKRCAGLGMPLTSPEEALSEEWLSRTDATLSFYSSLRDEFAPGKAMWLTETADAACGGNPWGSWFLDTFRFLDQAGRLARQGVQVVAHNTLVASDYGIIDETTLAPKPNYWGALLWRKLMGTTVLDAGVPARAGLHTYAHCLRGKAGGVALLVINADRVESQTLTVPTAGERYTLSGSLEGKRVELNGGELRLDARDELPPIGGAPTPAGDVTFAPATITFLGLPGAANDACRQAAPGQGGDRG